MRTGHFQRDRGDGARVGEVQRLQGRTLQAASRVPGEIFLLLQSSLGGMAKRPIPYELVRRWYRPLLTDPAVRRDFTAFLRGTRRDTYLRVPSGCAPSTVRPSSPGARRTA
ncbi:hypothetical protein [Streptomyces sp. NPDC048357]|uniref:hypothetical protein n=1 Tax=Streptomyces sp. NPDC048357 TaxID=3154719 RepID=UPI003433E088